MSNNIYYNPEKFGYTILGWCELSEPCWSFDTLVVFKRDEDGKLFWAHDSGCSCPQPFEYVGVDDLNPIVGVSSFRAEVKALGSRGYSIPDYIKQGVQDLILKVREELKK